MSNIAASSAAWRKSTYSAEQNCVFVTPTAASGAAVTDGKIGAEAGVIEFDAHSWAGLVEGLTQSRESR
jgi:hypothetical protein